MCLWCLLKKQIELMICWYCSDNGSESDGSGSGLGLDFDFLGEGHPD